MFIRPKLIFEEKVKIHVLARAAKIRVRTGPGHGLGRTWNKLKTSQTLSFHVPNTSETFRKNFFSSHFESGPRQHMNFNFFLKNQFFGRMNMRKRLLWPEICQFHSQKPYRTCRTLIFNFQRKSEFSLFFSLAWKAIKKLCTNGKYNCKKVHSETYLTSFCRTFFVLYY